MKIETKLNVGDTVLFIYSNKVVTDKINNINVTATSADSIHIVYTTVNHGQINENVCFATKEDLIKSL